jgi:hypothetical protein
MASKKSKNRDKKVQKTDFWESLSDRKKHLFCLGFLFILPIVLFYATVVGGQQYMGNDVIQWRAGAESLIEHQEQYDEPAHWATNMFSGMPATTISHPPQISNLDNTLLKFLQFIYPAAEMWILLGGAYLMFILLGARPLSAVFGAIIIGLTTYLPIIIGAGHNAKFLVYIYVPWLYNGYFLLTRSKVNPWLAMFLFAWALTLHLRSYHPQVTYFFLFPLGTLFIYDLVKAIQSKEFKPFAIHTGWLVGAAVVAVLISIQLYWSTLEYSSFSMRGGSELAGNEGLARDYAFAWSQGWGELLTLLIPGAYGGSELYWGPKSFTSGPHYFGALSLLFLIVGILKSTHKLKWVFLGPGIATLLFSLGENFGALNNVMFVYFPLFDKFRVPEMWLMISVFCFSVPAVFGLDWMLDKIREKKNSAQWKKPLYIASGVALIAILIGFQFLSFEKPGERQRIAEQIASQNEVPVDDPRVSQAVDRYLQNEMIPQREELARGDTLRFAFFFFAGVGILFAVGMQKLSLSIGGMLFCVLLAADFIRVDQRYMSERSLVSQDLDREQVLDRMEREIDRVLKDGVVNEEDWKYRVLPMLDNPFNNATPAYFYPSLGGYSGAKLGYYQDLIDEALFSGVYGVNKGVLNMLNVKYLSARGAFNIPGFEPVYQGEDGVVMENRDVLPKAWFVDRVERSEGQTDVLNQIAEDFNPSEVAFTVENVGDYPSDADRTVSVSTYNANEIELQINAEESGFLVLSEIWYPKGWITTLNGEPIDMIRTNYVLRGFEIPSGEHILTMKMEPVWYETGKWLSRIGTVMLFLILAVGLIQFRKEKGGEISRQD